MAYLSDVAVRIYGGAVQMEEFGYEYEDKFAELPEEVQLKVMDLEQNSFNLTGKTLFHVAENGYYELLFQATREKWYPGDVAFPAVSFFDDLFYNSTFNYPDLNIEYIRIGAEIDDVIVYFEGPNNEYRMELVRSINIGK